MKKMKSLVLVLLVLLSVGFVSARTIQVSHGMNVVKGEEIQNYGVFENNLSVHGLTIGLVQVSDDVALQKLESNMDMIKQRLELREQDKFVELKQVNNDSYDVVVEKSGKFLGLIPVNLRDTAIVNSDGVVTKYNKNFLWFLTTRE